MPETPFDRKLVEQIRWDNDRACQAEEDGDEAAGQAWYGYVQALRWVQSLSATATPLRVVLGTANLIVANQPAWKRNILEHSSRPTLSAPRTPVIP